MSILPYNSDYHTFQAFDVELAKLHGMLLNITELLSIQLELSIQAFEKHDSQYAIDSIGLIKYIQQIEVNIDLKVQAIIARFCPVANDLRAIISFLKVADKIEKIGDEIADFTLFVHSSFISQIDAIQPILLSYSIETGRYVLSFLNTLKAAIDTKETDLAFNVIEADRGYETELYNKLQNELIQIIKNKDYNNSIIILQIIKFLEFCPHEFRRIFSHIIFNRLSDHIFCHKWISDAAYYIAEHRNFTPGFETNDWLIAENQFLTKMILRYESIPHV